MSGKQPRQSHGPLYQGLGKQVGDDEVECSRYTVHTRSEVEALRHPVTRGVSLCSGKRLPIRVDGPNLAHAELCQCDRKHPGPGAEIQRSSDAMGGKRLFEQGEAPARAGVLAGAEGHAGVDHYFHPAGRRCCVPRRADIQSVADALRTEVQFPVLGPVLVGDLARANRRLAQRSTDIGAESAQGFQRRRQGEIRNQAHVAIALLPLGPWGAALDQEIRHRFAEFP